MAHMEGGPRLALGVMFATCLGMTGCGSSEGFVNTQTAEVIRQRDDGECPEGVRVRFGALLANQVSTETITATYVGKDEERREDFYRIHNGMGDQNFFIRRRVDLPHDRYGEFGADKVIVAGEVEMSENEKGQDECQLYVVEMYEAPQSQPSTAPSQ